MIKNRIILLIIFLFVASCTVSRNERTPLQVALDSLSEEQLSTLEIFFRVILAKSQGGYVLYGNKPLCLEAFAHREEGSIFLAKWIHLFSTQLKRGALLWKDLGLDKYCHNYHLIISENLTNQWQDLLLINRKEMFASVEKNLILFQYALGPKITAEDLIDQLQDPQSNFSAMMQNDKTLIGILLGYGTQNAMHCNRMENIKENNCSKPSYGFNTTEEELEWFAARYSLSTEFSEEKLPLLPWFGCYDVHESKLLIENYKQTQKELTSLLKSPNFLEKVLSRIFEKKVSLKPYNSAIMPSLPKKGELITAVAQGIWCCISEKDPEYISSFIQGLQASEHGMPPLTEEEFCGLRNQAPIKDNDSRKEMAFHAGVRTWDHFKKGKDLYSLSDILPHISKGYEFISLDDHTDRILTNLHYWLYTNSLENRVMF